MIRSHADVLAAHEAGRSHTQRFIKTGQSGVGAYDGRWQDWAFQAGQPAYDARIGTVNSFTPVVAVRNDAIYFPDIPVGMERKLHKLTMRPQASGVSQATMEFVLYDLVGYYPLIDGDSTDPQDMSNSLTLPRYTDGEGLRLVMLNHVAPATQAGRMLLEYTNSANQDKTLDVLVPNNSINSVCSGVNTVGTTSLTNLNLPLGGTGIRRVNRVTYTVPPGGLHCLYVVKLLAQFTHYHDFLMQGDPSGAKAALEVDFALKNGWRMPVIKDGAHLAFFFRVNGGGRSNTFFGDATFIWG
jgi:hypothetical protein